MFYISTMGSHMLGVQYREISNEVILTVNLGNNKHCITIFSINDGENSIFNANDLIKYSFFQKYDDNDEKIENEYIDTKSVSMQEVLLQLLEPVEKYKNKKIKFKYKIS